MHSGRLCTVARRRLYKQATAAIPAAHNCRRRIGWTFAAGAAPIGLCAPNVYSLRVMQRYIQADFPRCRLKWPTYALRQSALKLDRARDAATSLQLPGMQKLCTVRTHPTNAESLWL
jgi:hypothetical protein